MSLDAVVDNDIVIKGACYALLGELLAGFGGGASLGVLGAARYVVRDRLSRHQGLRDRVRAEASWAAFLSAVHELEPTDAEVELATLIEEAAGKAGVSVDVGESQLCAIAISRDTPRVITGDKRAIQGIEAILGVVDQLAELSGRVGCLEQVVAAVAERIGGPAVRALVCAEPDIDRAVSICLHCLREDAGDFDRDGLDSYVRHLRSLAPTLIIDGSLFP